MTPSGSSRGSQTRAHHNANLILQTLKANGLGSDNRLPTERQLVIDLGLSRTSVRNALSYLEEAGIVTREVGRGTFLCQNEQINEEIALSKFGSNGLALNLRDVSPINVMAVRFIIEPPAMILVAAEATAEDFDEMDRCIYGGDGAHSYEEFESWDLALHRCLVAASHNPLLVKIYASIEAARHSPLWGDLKRRNDSLGKRHSYQCEHRDIVDKLKERNARGARDAMRIHLQSVEQALRLQISM